MPLYHVSYENYNIGDTLSPGKWGRYIKTLSSLNHEVRLEMILEDKRLQLYPAAISRLNCIYAFNNSTIAENFALSRSGANIYELDIANETPTSVHNYKVISFFRVSLKESPHQLLNNNEQLLEQYWTGNNTSTWTDNIGNTIDYVEEILIGGQATIIKIF